MQGGGVGAVDQGRVEEPLPPGPVLSQRDKALGTLKALVQVLGVAGYGVGGGVIAQKPASPVPTTPTHAEMVARLHELYDSEKKVSKKVEEAKGRLETARAKVMEAEEGMAKVDGELQGIQALLSGDGRKSRSAEDTFFVEEAGSSEEVGVRVEVGKRRKVAKQGRFCRER